MPAYTDDEAPLDDEARRLVEGYYRLARWLAIEALRKIPNPERSRIEPDVWSQVHLSLCRLARNFDASRGWKFATYARPRLKWAIHDAIRMARPRGFRSTDDAAPDIVTLDERAPLESHDHHVGWEVESSEAVESMLARIRDRHQIRSVLMSLYLDPAFEGRQDRLAVAMGVRPSRVSQLVAEGHARLAAILSHEGDRRCPSS